MASPTWALVNPDTGEELSLTSWPFGVVVDSVEVGEPEAQVEESASALADGDWAEYVRDGNREYVMTVIVEGHDLGDLAYNEATLRRWSKVSRTVGGARLLRHDPGDGFSAASDYEVKVGTCRLERDDTDEAHTFRRWTLTFICGPYARSTEPVTVEGVASGVVPVVTVVDTCDSLTGWSGTYSPGPAVLTTSGGYINYQSAGGTSTPVLHSLTLTRAGSIDLTTTGPYLMVDWERFAFALEVPSPLTVNGVAPALTSAISPTRRRSFFLLGAVVVNEITLALSAAGAAGLALRVHDVSASNTTSGSDYKRQGAYVLYPGGTERTPASIRVEGTTMQGTTIVHTSPNDGSGYSPPTSRWYVSGNTQTADAATFSGRREPLTPNPVIADVPTRALPEGGYLLAAHLRSDTGTFSPFPIDWSINTHIGGINVGPVVSGSTGLLFSANEWRVHALALVTLPTIRTSSGMVRVSVQYNGSAAAIEMDEAWLFRVDDDCALTIINGQRKNVWLDSPSLSTHPQPRIWMGNEPDRSDQLAPEVTGLLASGSHFMSPQGTLVYGATLLADYPGVSSTHNTRWHTNVPPGVS